MPPVFSKMLQHPLVHGCGFSRRNRTSPCEVQCPAGTHIQRVHACVEQGDFTGALAWLHARNPFPGVTGRTCPHPCELACNRVQYDEAVGIRALERLVADQGIRSAVRPASPTGKSVGIVGGGPAGLTCAWFAALLGHTVTVYEAAPVAGGIPRVAVPDFRLPKDIVDREVAAILELGVRVHTNVRVGQDISLEVLRARHHACVIAAGSWNERCPACSGGDTTHAALRFLTGVGLAREGLSNRHVVILGGGGVALDCAFTARRLGAASMTLLCLEAEDALHAPKEELTQAHEEGVRILGSRFVERLVPEGNAFRAEFRQLSAFSFAPGGMLQVSGLSDTVESCTGDIFIAASGLLPDLGFASDLGMDTTPRGYITVNEFGETSVPGLLAAGDAAHGPTSIAEAVGSGRRAAMGLHRFLLGIDTAPQVRVSEVPQVRVREVPQVRVREGAIEVFQAPDGTPKVVALEDIWNVSWHEKIRRAEVCANTDSELPFAELSTGYTSEAGQEESKRCLHCGQCRQCGSCVEACPGHILTLTDDGPVVSYPDECWHCGCCRLACPTGSITYRFPLNMLV